MPPHSMPHAEAQAIRLQSVRLGLAFYTLCALVMGFLAWHGFYPWFPLAIFTAGFTTVSAVFHLIIQSGWNLRVKEKSMTEAQIVCSALLCSYTLIYAGSFRGLFMLAYVVGLMFSSTQVTMRQLIRLALLPVLLYPVVALIARAVDPATFDWRVDVVYWISLCVLMLFTAMLVGKLMRLRLRLKASNTELESALAKLTIMAERDELTGLYNRRHLMDVLEREKSRADRSGGNTFCVCLIDLDHFKRVNDTFGHGNGDTVLRTLARVAEQCIRGADCLGRWGGEEFLLLQPETSVESAEVCVQRIRAELERTAFEGLPAELRVTLSAGIAQYQHADSVTNLIDRADRALYQAKRNGRNRVMKAEMAEAGVSVGYEDA